MGGGENGMERKRTRMNGFSWIKSLKINNSIFHLLILSISIYMKSRSTCQEVAPPPPPPPACIYICPEGHSSMKEDETSTKQTKEINTNTTTLQYVFLPVVSIAHTGPSSVVSLLQENFGFGKRKPRQFTDSSRWNVYPVRNAIS